MLIQSPQRQQHAPARRCRLATQSPHTGGPNAFSSGSPQTRQSPGKTVVTRSPTARPATCEGLRSTRATARQLRSAKVRAALSSSAPPGGPSAPIPSCPFKRSLKTHLLDGAPGRSDRAHARSISPGGYCKSIRLCVPQPHWYTPSKLNRATTPESSHKRCLHPNNSSPSFPHPNHAPSSPFAHCFWGPSSPCSSAQ